MEELELGVSSDPSSSVSAKHYEESNNSGVSVSPCQVAAGSGVFTPWTSSDNILGSYSIQHPSHSVELAHAQAVKLSKADDHGRFHVLPRQYFPCVTAYTEKHPTG